MLFSICFRLCHSRSHFTLPVPSRLSFATAMPLRAHFIYSYDLTFHSTHLVVFRVILGVVCSLVVGGLLTFSIIHTCNKRYTVELHAFFPVCSIISLSLMYLKMTMKNESMCHIKFVEFHESENVCTPYVHLFMETKYRGFCFNNKRTDAFPQIPQF